MWETQIIQMFFGICMTNIMLVLIFKMQFSLPFSKMNFGYHLFQNVKVLDKSKFSQYQKVYKLVLWYNDFIISNKDQTRLIDMVFFSECRPVTHFNSSAHPFLSPKSFNFFCSIKTLSFLVTKNSSSIEIWRINFFYQWNKVRKEFFENNDMPWFINES